MTAPSPARRRPMRSPSFAANPATSVLLVPPRAFARASQSSRSMWIVIAGTTTASSPSPPRRATGRGAGDRAISCRRRAVFGPVLPPRQAPGQPQVRPGLFGGHPEPPRAVECVNAAGGSQDRACCPGPHQLSRWRAQGRRSGSGKCTKLTAVEPSVRGRTPRCQPGPHSGSIGSCERSSAQSLSSARGRAHSAISMSDGPRSKTHRCRANGSGERSMRRPNNP